MSDHYFNQFYNDVRAKDWPDATNYAEYLKLPEWMQEECISDHSLEKRLHEIEDHHHWRRLSGPIIGFRKADVVFLPVYKCGSSYYTEILETQGWEKANIADLDLQRLHAIGVLIHPLTRRLKGIAEGVHRTFKHDYDKINRYMSDPDFRNFLNSISILDDHSIPYTIAFGEKLDQIHWIPAELFTYDQIDSQIRSFCKRFDVDIDFPQNYNRGESGASQRMLYNTIKDDWLHDPKALVETYMLFADDLKFYHALLRKVKDS